MPLPPSVEPLGLAPEYLAGRDIVLRARVVDSTPPDSGVLFIRPVAGGFYRGFRLRPEHGYVYGATVPAAAVRAGGGPYEFVITLFRGDSRLTFPAAVPEKPTDWDYSGRTSWQVDLVEPQTPLRLFNPGTDAVRLAFTRLGDAGRRCSVCVPRMQGGAGFPLRSAGECDRLPRGAGRQGSHRGPPGDHHPCH